jgi:integrase
MAPPLLRSIFRRFIGIVVTFLHGASTDASTAASSCRSVLQHRLGHASIQMTSDRYGHLFSSGNTGAEMAAAKKSLLG